MAFNGAGVYAAPSNSWNPAVAGTVISETDWATLLADLSTALTLCITKDGQSTTSGTIPFATAINSTLVTDSTSIGTGAIRTAGGLGVTKALWVGGLANVAGAVTLQSTLAVTGATTLSAALTYGGVTLTNAVTGTGKMVLDTSPTLVSPALGTPSSGLLTNCTGLPVAGGGTGRATLTANYVLLGDGTTAVQMIAPSTSGNVLKSNGTTWASGAGGASTPDVQTFSASGTWTKPSGGQTWARVQVWGAGGGAGRSGTTSGGMGGAGGAYNEVWVPLSYLGSTETVTVGTGGAGRSSSAGTGTIGGNSSFVLTSYPGGSKTMYAYGGGAGGSDYSTAAGNVIGGGQLSAGGLDSGVLTTGRPRQTGDQGDGAIQTATAIMWGGGNVIVQNIVAPGETVYGGAAGGFMVTSTAVSGGQSVWGGNGGNGHATAPTAGTIPGGGGGGGGVNVNGASGGDGKIIVISY